MQGAVEVNTSNMENSSTQHRHTPVITLLNRTTDLLSDRTSAFGNIT